MEDNYTAGGGSFDVPMAHSTAPNPTDLPTYLLLSKAAFVERATQRRVREWCNLPDVAVSMKGSGIIPPVFASVVIPLLGQRLKLSDAVCVGPMAAGLDVCAKLSLPPGAVVLTADSPDHAAGERIIRLWRELCDLEAKNVDIKRQISRLETRIHYDSNVLSNMSSSWRSLGRRIKRLEKAIVDTGNAEIDRLNAAKSDVVRRAVDVSCNLATAVRPIFSHDQEFSALDDEALARRIRIVFAYEVYRSDLSDNSYE